MAKYWADASDVGSLNTGTEAEPFNDLDFGASLANGDYVQVAGDSDFAGSPNGLTLTSLTGVSIVWDGVGAKPIYRATTTTKHAINLTSCKRIVIDGFSVADCDDGVRVAGSDTSATLKNYTCSATGIDYAVHALASGEMRIENADINGDFVGMDAGGVRLGGALNLTVVGSDFYGFTLSAANQGAIDIAVADVTVRLEDCRFWANEQHVRVEATATDVSLEANRCVFDGALKRGIYAAGPSGSMTFANCAFQATAAGGTDTYQLQIAHATGALEADFLFCTMDFRATVGDVHYFASAVNAEKVTVRNCAFTSSGGDVADRILFIHDSSNVLTNFRTDFNARQSGTNLDNCVIHNVTTISFADYQQAADEGEFTVSAADVLTIGGSWYLPRGARPIDGSSALGAGNWNVEYPDRLLDYDLVGNPRTRAAAPDCGCFSTWGEEQVAKGLALTYGGLSGTRMRP